MMSFNITRIVFSMIVVASAWCWGQSSSAESSKSSETMMAKADTPVDCTGTAASCKKPVKFLSKTASCVCFTCGYGTSESKQLCTKNYDEAKSFAKLARQSGFADEDMNKAITSVPNSSKKDHSSTDKGPNI